MEMASARYYDLQFLLLLSVTVSLTLGHAQQLQVSGRPATAPAPNLTTVDNGVISIGVDSNRGGSITFLAREPVTVFLSVTLII